MGSRPRLRLHGARLCVGITERGMGPRIREDNWGDGFPSPSSRRQALRGNNGRACMIRGRLGGWGRLEEGGEGLDVFQLG